MRIARRQEHLAAGASNQRGHAVDTQDLPVHLRGDRGIEPALNHDEQPGEAESCHPSRGDPDNLADHEQVQERNGSREGSRMSDLLDHPAGPQEV